MTGKTTIFTNILTEIYCGRGHWKYERPFVNKEVHMKNNLKPLISRNDNLVPRFPHLPVDRPWLGLVTCLPESGRLQTNNLGEGKGGRISVRFV